jgi:small subunit ribosomal protein S4
MARYTGPTCRLCRYLGEKLMLKGEKCFTPKCPLEKKNSSPGEHSLSRRRRRVTERGFQLREKQKVRFSYGIFERQFRKFFHEAQRARGVTGENLLILLERRLDNVVYRLGFASSRAQARQIVRHGHILVNGRKLDIPTYLVRPDDVIAWRESSTKTGYYKQLFGEIKGRTIPGWLSLDEENVVGKVLTSPTKDDLDAKFDAKVIVEYYSR